MLRVHVHRYRDLDREYPECVDGCVESLIFTTRCIDELYVKIKLNGREICVWSREENDWRREIAENV